MEMKVSLPGGGLERCEVIPSGASPWRLTVSGIGEVQREFCGDDLFDALTALRSEFEARGCRLLCAGARVDVFPSGMSRSMGGGRKAYVTKLGKPTGETSLVDIFDYAEPNLVGTVEEQQEFRKRWIASLRERVQ